MYGEGKLLTLAGMGPSVRTMTILQNSPSPEKPGAATESGGARNGVLTLAGDTWSLSMGSLTCSQQKVHWCSGGEQLWSTTTIGSIAPKLFLLYSRVASASTCSQLDQKGKATRRLAVPDIRCMYLSGL